MSLLAGSAGDGGGTGGVVFPSCSSCTAGPLSLSARNFAIVDDDGVERHLSVLKLHLPA